MEYFFIFIIIVVIIALIRVYRVFPAAKKRPPKANEEDPRYLWFPGENGGSSGRDGFDGGGSDGGGGSSTHF